MKRKNGKETLEPEEMLFYYPMKFGSKINLTNLFKRARAKSHFH